MTNKQQLTDEQQKIKEFVLSYNARARLNKKIQEANKNYNKFMMELGINIY